MAEITVGSLAQKTNKSLEALLKQLASFGINKSSESDTLTSVEMKTLLENINSTQSLPTRKKVTTTMRLGGKHKINVSIKKKKRVISKAAEEIEPPKLSKIEEHSSVQKEVIKPDNSTIETTISKPEEVTVSKEATISKPDKSTPGVVNRSKDIESRTSDFKIVSMPEQTSKPVGELNAPKSEKKKTTKKTFSNNSKSNVKYKKAGSSFKKTGSRKSSELLKNKFVSKKDNSRISTINKQEFTKPVDSALKTVEIYRGITVGELAKKMAVKGAEIVKILFKMGAMATINQSLDQDTAILVVEEMGHKYTLHNDNALEETVTTIDRGKYKKVSRAPVVTIMGHVDHGKTSLLDCIRKSRVVAGEAGGITQHIGAYSIKTKKGLVTFLDTPGHEAFTSMRARGARLTDIVILVVAADDGVMPQTKEAVEHAKAAGVPIVVAVNKIDKPGSNPDKVISELAQIGIMSESWGGEVMFAHVSAKTGEGIFELLDAVLLQSEVLELEAFAEGHAEGIVVESRLEKGRGPVATVLIKNGSLKQSDIVLCGKEFGRVRRMYDDLGKQIKSAGPSTPVEILGLSSVAVAGDQIVVVESEKKAKEVAKQRSQKQKEAKIAQEQSLKLSNMSKNMARNDEEQVLKIILKGDVQGSAEAIKESLLKLSTDAVKVNIIASGIGGITSSDVALAIASTAVVVGFNVRADSSAKKLAESGGVELRYYNIIYDLIDDITKAMSGLLSPEMKEQIIGIAEVREIYKSSKFGSIAGCMVIEGVIKRTNPIRVLRDSVVIYEGSLESLKRFKEDINEVKKGFECGIGVKNYNDIRAGDQVEVFEIVEVIREL